MKQTTVLMIGMALCVTTSVPASTAHRDFGKTPLYFVANTGQVDEEAAFYAKASGYTLWLTKKGLVFDTSIQLGSEASSADDPAGHPTLETEAGKRIRRDVSNLRFIGANRSPEIVSLNETEYRVNYFRGDKANWKTGVPTSEAVLYKNIYSHIDLKVYGIEKQVEYDWIVHPGGNPDDIRIEYRDVQGTAVNSIGDIAIETGTGMLVHKSPVSFQRSSSVGSSGAETEAVHVAFDHIGGNVYGLDVDEYDATRTLVIDPVVYVEYATYLGGADYDLAYRIQVDSNGCVYVLGTAASTDFPTTSGTYDELNNGSEDGFITKFSSSGDSLIYSTYIGGDSIDSLLDLAIDSTGAAYGYGYSYSTNFPTVNPVQGVNHGNPDIVVFKLNPAGDELVYSTYLGGTGIDYGLGFDVDDAGCAYAFGETYSSNYPTTNAMMATYPGDRSLFVSKFSASGNSLVYSTYFGGSSYDEAGGIAADSNGCAYITGATRSSDYPVTNAYDDTINGSGSAYLTKFTPDGSNLVFSTYFSGFYTKGREVVVDEDGYVYLTGDVNSTNMPTVNPYQEFRAGSSDAFITKFTPDGSNLVYSTYLGGGQNDYGYRLALDKKGRAYVTGYTFSGDFPTTNACQDTLKGDRDAFVTIFSPSGNVLEASTYFGGTYRDYGYGIAVDSGPFVYLAGRTQSDDFPATNAFQDVYGGNSDAFLAKFTFWPVFAPDSGPHYGGNVVRITNGGVLGSGSDVTNVTVCGVMATILDQGENWVEVTTGIGPSGGVTGNIVVQSTSEGGTTFTNAYTYNPAGVINQVLPSSGPSVGGNQVVIGGTNLCDGGDITNVTLCGTSVISIDSRSATQVVVTAASGTPGTGNVVVYSISYGITTSSNAYTYNPPGVITQVTPSSGSRAGGYQVVIGGTDLCDGGDITNVTLRGIGVTSIDSQSATQVVVTAGFSASGTGDVIVCSTSYGITTKSNAFEYLKDKLVFYADASKADDSGNGRSWATAKKTIQAAVDLTEDNDSVLVTNGVYDTGGDVEPGLSLTNRVMVNRAITVEGINGPTNTFIVGAADPISTNGPAAVRCVRLVDGAVLSGFTLTNGHTLAVGDQNTERGAGGVLLDHGGVVSNCVIVGNVCHGRGAGVNCHHGGAVYDSIIRHNHSMDDAGGMLVEGGRVEDCDIHGNSTGDDGGGLLFYASGSADNVNIYSNTCVGAGGGIYFYNGGSISNSTIEANTSGSGGGGILMRTGALIENCTIRNNHAGDGTTEDGGGIWFYTGGTARNCLVEGNSAQNTGGGAFFSNAASNAVLESCTVVSNTAEDGGGIRTWGGMLRNCIVYGNTATVINTNWSWGGNSPSIEYTCTTPTNGVPGGAGCIEDDPQFADVSYRLSSGSPCTDAGTNQAWMSGVTDIDGVPRIQGLVDMGCYEGPWLDITTTPTTVSYDITVYAIAGTNYATSAGTWVSNQLNGASVNAGSGSDWSADVPLAVGENVMIAYGTNAFGSGGHSESIHITRGGVGTGAPYVDVTNESETVTHDFSTYTIGGTNNIHVTGMMRWTNELSGASDTFGPFEIGGTNWTVDVPLTVGTNLVTVSGTNQNGEVASDSVTITRGQPGTGVPMVDITDPTGVTATVAFEVTSYALSGTTDADVVGTMWVSNAANGEAHSFAASENWTAPAVTLTRGATNILTVTGTNLVGQTAADSVGIFRSHPIAQVDTSTYLGGSGSETSRGVAVDESGNIYVLGYTSSTDFPTTNAYQSTRADPNNYFDLFLTKFAPDGSNVIYSTYLGGTYYEYGYGIAVHTDETVYVVGYTQSTDFPTTNAFQSSYNNNRDIFVSRVSADGSSLIYSTYFGGSSDDRAYGLAVGHDGSAFVTGWTQSDDFPVTNAYQSAWAGSYEPFVARFSPEGGLIYSTYLGGSSVDYGYGIAVDSNLTAFIAGSTQSADFPITNAYQSALAGIVDAFVVRLSADGSNLLYSTYLGGADSGETGYAIAVDADSTAYITGYTSSDDFPVTNAYQTTRAGDDDAFVSALASSGSNLIYSTYLGGALEDDAYGIAVGDDGAVSVAGRTFSDDFPTVKAFQTSRAGAEDGFMFTLKPGGEKLLCSTYLGGNDTDCAFDIAVDPEGSPWVSGYTESDDFPVTNAFQPEYGGGSRDAFVTKLLIPQPGIVITTQTQIVLGTVAELTVAGTHNRDAFGKISWTNTATGTGGFHPIAGLEFSFPGIPLAFGDNLITVSGTNEIGILDSDSVVITRSREHGPGSPIHYVSTNGAAVWPYTNWTDAAICIQDAVDAASSNDTVLVADGVYDSGGAITPGHGLWNRVAITRAIRVASVNGAEVTSIVGADNPAAMDLDSASSQYVRVEDDPALDLVNNYTLEAWIYPRSFNWLGGIMSKYHTASANGYTLRLGNATPSYSGINFDEMSTTNGVLQSNQWYHVAAVNDAGTRRLYVNGVEKPLSGTPLAVTNNTDPVCIGVDYLSSPRCFDGIVDEVRIWNKGRSQTEVQETMNRRLSGREPGLVGYWPLDEGSGTSTMDGATNGNDGALMNFADWETNNTAQVQMRCAYLAEGASLSGFTLTNGHTFATGDWNYNRGGGGVILFSGSVVSNCIISGCSATRYGGGVNLFYGGTLDRCMVRGNRSLVDGGGIAGIYGGTVRNSLITDNTAVDDGGGVFGSTTLLLNSTVAGNSGSSGGGIYGDTNSVCRNGIIYGNMGGEYTGGLTFEYSCTSNDSGGTGCITNDPEFVDAVGSDFHLQNTSPCIDAGTNTAGLVSDLDGTPRPLDGDADSTNTVDMGCYEYLNRSADSDGDTMTDGYENDHGLDPTADDADGNPDNDPHNNREEFIADTDPTDSNDYFRIAGISNNSPVTVYFDSSSNRWYSLLWRTNPLNGAWTNIVGPRVGIGGTDGMQSTNELPVEFLRLQVEIRGD